MNSGDSKSAPPRVGVLRTLNARLRFVFLMAAVGVVAANWERITNYYDRWRRPAHLPDTVEAAAVEYYCPMHPHIVRSEPGQCPICGMPLAKRAKSQGAATGEATPSTVQLSPQKVLMGGIATTPVGYELLVNEIRAVGVVDYDETSLAYVAARIQGRLDKLYVNFVGQTVQKGEPLASIYSPGLLIAQDELLSAMRQLNEQGDRTGMALTTAKSLVDAARQKLRLWGITDEQVEAIIQAGKAETHLTITSPIQGIVAEKKVLEGHYVNEGDDLYVVADLGRVWVQAKVFEDEIAGVQVGTAVEVTSVAYPNEVFAGRIAFVAYTVDAATRTIAARVEVANPQLKLKPGMYVRAVIRLPAGEVAEAPAEGATPGPAGMSPIDEVAAAYLLLVGQYARDKADAEALAALSKAASNLSAAGVDDTNSIAAEIAATADGMRDQPLDVQRERLKKLSAKVIALLKKQPPTQDNLFVAHCPMVDGDWVQTSREITNPYYGSAMLRCGEITAHVAATGPGGERYLEGYYCPLHPDQLLDSPVTCPIDNLPTRRVRIARSLAVPETAVIRTGGRSVVYKEVAAGEYEIVVVRLGPRSGGFYPVIEGLSAGERVVTAGAFLVDAENRLNPAAGAQYFGAMDTARGAGAGQSN